MISMYFFLLGRVRISAVKKGPQSAVTELSFAKYSPLNTHAIQIQQSLVWTIIGRWGSKRDTKNVNVQVADYMFAYTQPGEAELQLQPPACALRIRKTLHRKPASHVVVWVSKDSCHLPPGVESLNKETIKLHQGKCRIHCVLELDTNRGLQSRIFWQRSLFFL